MHRSIIRIHANDNVAVALRPIAYGEIIPAQEPLAALEDIPQGHKIAITSIAAGENIVKYGFPIGHATKLIRSGEHVHTHNAATNLQEETAYVYHPSAETIDIVEPDSFFGYRRKDGSVGIRNEIWIIPTVGCVNDCAREIARLNQHLVCGTIDGLYAFPHPYGCSQTGEDHASTRRLLASLAKHPNAGAVLVLSLGCENLTHEQFSKELGDFDRERIQFLTCQDAEDEIEAAGELLQKCAAYASQFVREPLPCSKLLIGLKCGGSDGLSGITANPCVGKLCDRLIAHGGSAILTEVPEMFGAEGLILNRCISQDVFKKAVDMLSTFKQYYIRHGEAVYENPSPGNKDGGITTLEDKSCGCVQKGGTAPVTDVIGYGERVGKKGLSLMYGPGNDLVSTTALTAAGAHIILFTTGRGTPFGAPAPTIKISTNTALAQKKKGWIDFNAGTVADGEATIDEAADSLMQLIISTASGKLTKTEVRGFREISIFKNGVTL